MTISAATPTIPSATAGAAGSAAAGSGKTALSSLSGNLNDFLKLLMTQLKNQDPTAPMDTNTFTTQLVQFSSVEQQINTNTSLNTLIQATQGNTLLQSSSLVGKGVQVTSDQLSLQGGQAGVRFTTATPQPVDISVYDASGTKLVQARVSSTAGDNAWSWNGQTAGGTQLPDGRIGWWWPARTGRWCRSRCRRRRRGWSGRARR